MKISKEKKDKISEQILQILYIHPLKPLFTSNIAREIARDEEFIKNILLDLKHKKVVTEINKNSKGIPYLRRSRWVLSVAARNFYKNNSSTPQP